MASRLSKQGISLTAQAIPSRPSCEQLALRGIEQRQIMRGARGRAPLAGAKALVDGPDLVGAHALNSAGGRRCSTPMGGAQRAPLGFLDVTRVMSAGSNTSTLCVIGVVSTYCARVDFRKWPTSWMLRTSRWAKGSSMNT